MPDDRRREEAEDPTIEAHSRFAPGTARSALSHPVFRTVFIGAWLSNIGTWMQQVVLAAYAYNLTESSTFVGQLVFAQFGPTLVLGLFGGVVVDMIDRKKLLLVVSVAQMALAFVLAAVVSSDDPSRGLMFLTALGSGIAASLYLPAYGAILPGLVGHRDLPGAIALNTTQMNASRVVGPAIGGVAFATVGPAWVFVGNAVSFVFVIVALLRVHLPPAPPREREPIRRELTGGIRAARRDPVVGRALITITVFSLFSIVYVGMMAVLAAENLGIEEDSVAYGVFYACFGLGGVIGSIANGTVLSGMAKPILVRRGLVAYAVAVSALALLRSPVPAYPTVMIVGATYFGMVTALATAMQSRLVDHERGRVLALWTMGFGGTVSLANLAFGPVVDEIGMTPVMLFGAAVAAALAWYADLDRAAATATATATATADAGIPSPSPA